jgi:serine/threonine protein kinase/tetratricopeptide (TPR) repeat protein
MPTSVRRFEVPAAGAMITRCPSCGRRVRDACPEHGRVENPDPDSAQISGPTIPQFAGYVIKRIVGSGGFGTVYEAAPDPPAPGMPATVAIKLPRPDRADASECMTHERAVLADVGPPHVPRLFGSGELGDGTPYVVMEYLTTPTLSERLIARAAKPGETPAPMPLADACALAISILRALEAVHDKGYVHRDLKPENIFVDERDRQVTLVDFGLVAALDLSKTRDTTIAGAGVGTAEYMSPEQCEGRADIDARADVYAMGVILYELIAGHPPFWGPRTVIKEAHLSRRPPRLSAVVAGAAIPRALDDLVARCLAKDRRDRFEDVAALREAIEAVLAAIAAPRPLERPTMRSPTNEAGSAAKPRAGEEGGPAAPGAKGDRPTVGLLFFASRADVVAVQGRISSLGGQLAHAAGGRFVVAYGQEHGENPARRALRAAEELLRQEVTDRVRLDLAPVMVQTRKDGSKRFVSPLFARADRFPAEGDALGISLTPAAAAVVPEGAIPAAADEPPARPAKKKRAAEGGVTDVTAEMAAWPIIGRDAVLEALVAAARRAEREGVPSTASVVGEAGEGKSHLFRVLVKRLGDLGVAEVLALRAREPALGDVDHTLAELLQRVLDLPSAPPVDGGRELLRERLGVDEPRPRVSISVAPRAYNPTITDLEGSVSSTLPGMPSSLEIDPGPASRAPRSGPDLAPAVAVALGWVSPDAPDSTMRPELKALGAAPGALRSALTVAAGGALRRRAGKRPLFVVLDDAHWASDVLLSALEYAALADGGAPLWICALGRPSFERENPSWGERAARREQHRLGPLDPASAAALCRRLLLPVDSVADSAVQRLVDRAQAIPLLLVELVRGLRREGIIRKSPKGESWYLATDELDRLPDLPLIEWLARSELDALAPTLRGHARLLALSGEQVTVADLEGILMRLEQAGGDRDFPLDARIATQRLLAAGVVIEDREGNIGFRHALVREAIARGTPEALRRRIHHAAAEHYAGAAAGRSEEHRLAQIAYHAGAAGMSAIAERAYLDLAERARARHAYTDAERLYSRALEQGGDATVAERAAAYRGRGLMRYRIGRYHDALTDFSCARELVIQDGDVAAQIEILLDEATALDWMDDYKTSEERVQQARALLPKVKVSSPLLEARVLLGVARAQHRFSRNEEAAALFEKAAEAAEPLGEDGYETLVIALMLVGFILPGLGRLDDAIRALDHTIALCESHGDRLHLAVAVDHRALVWGYLGDKDRMVADMERALSLGREIGQLSMDLIAEYNYGEFLLLLDDADAAEPHIRRAIEIDRKLSGDPGRPVVALLEARLRLYRGDEDGARAIASRIRERQASLRASGESDALMAPSEDVICTMIELATRDAAIAEWDDLEVRSERFSVGQERIEVIETRALACARRDRGVEAEHHLERAVDVATRIPNAMSARLNRRLVELRKR